MSEDREQALERARILLQEAGSDARSEHSERALKAVESALEILFPLGLSRELCDALVTSGIMLRDTGDDGEAKRRFHQALALATGLEYPIGRARAQNGLGSIAQLHGDLQEAELLYTQAATLAAAIGEKRLWALNQQNLGLIAQDQGRSETARVLFQDALIALEELGFVEPAMAWVLNNLGFAYARDGMHGRAAAMLDRARELAIALGDAAAEGIIEENRAASLAKLGDFAEAERAAMRAAVIAEQRHDLIRRAAALRAVAHVWREQGRSPEDLADVLETALVLLDTGKDALLQIEVLTDLGDAYQSAGNEGRARTCWNRALQLAESGGFQGLDPALHRRLRDELRVTTRLSF